MTYNLTIEQRRKYRQNEVERHGLLNLNRKHALTRALKKGYVTPQSYAKYQFTASELPFLDTLGADAFQTGYSSRLRAQRDKVS